MSDIANNGRFSDIADQGVYVADHATSKILLDHQNELIAALIPGDNFCPSLSTFSPIGLFGESGSGKSSFADLILDGVIKRKPLSDLRIDAGDFARGYAVAVDTDSVSDWRNRFLLSDILLIDRLHTIENKPEALREIAELIDAFADEQKALIYCSCKPLTELDIERSLASRLSAGLIVNLNSPGLDARRKFFALAAEKLGLIFEPDALELLSKQTAGNFATLGGLLTTFKSFLLIDQANHSFLIDVDRVVVFLDSLTENDRELSVKKIAIAVARHFGIKLSDLRGESRRRNFVRARQICIHLCRKVGSFPLERIGEYLGDRDHTTILHSERKMDALVETDADIRKAIELLTEKLSTKGCSLDV